MGLTIALRMGERWLDMFPASPKEPRCGSCWEMGLEVAVRRGGGADDDDSDSSEGEVDRDGADDSTSGGEAPETVPDREGGKSLWEKDMATAPIERDEARLREADDARERMERAEEARRAEEERVEAEQARERAEQRRRAREDREARAQERALRAGPATRRSARAPQPNPLPPGEDDRDDGILNLGTDAAAPAMLSSPVWTLPPPHLCNKLRSPPKVAADNGEIYKGFADRMEWCELPGMMCDVWKSTGIFLEEEYVAIAWKDGEPDSNDMQSPRVSLQSTGWGLALQSVQVLKDLSIKMVRVLSERDSVTSTHRFQQMHPPLASYSSPNSHAVTEPSKGELPLGSDAVCRFDRACHPEGAVTTRADPIPMACFRCRPRVLPFGGGVMLEHVYSHRSGVHNRIPGFVPSPRSHAGRIAQKQNKEDDVDVGSGRRPPTSKATKNDVAGYGRVLYAITTTQKPKIAYKY
ncbi:hypothetical protein BDK51DRAFT_51021 [Blyttiomyces helicus]|uniref:Uncharacterized protein n=1 Tax=Blyttiomyces helicus TaxID=388810 RepID=A0A4P9WBU8_9FUNG|nr:hypothetical protein BDK51DRAFT_51021 [Blyttiomyces helicus]|eukprot:RKO90101.1 hypothetical protein BDK51DRAFT_51021 [Blyttiomyces helicus]